MSSLGESECHKGYFALESLAWNPDHLVIDRYDEIDAIVACCAGLALVVEVHSIEIKTHSVQNR